MMIGAIIALSTIALAIATDPLYKPPAPLQLGDINILYTTDLHGWLQQRAHSDFLDASLADVLSLYERMRDLARSEGKDLFLFDNGDIVDGTGLSGITQDRVAAVAPIMMALPYDALTPGNHEMYDKNGGGVLRGRGEVGCGLEGLAKGGFIAEWGEAFLTGNIDVAATGEPLGSRFRVLEGEFGRTVLTFGFMYDFTDDGTCDFIDVGTVASAVAAPWFADALAKEAPRADAIVVLLHADFQNALVGTVLDAIRAHPAVSPNTVVQFLTGHTHRRGLERPLGGGGRALSFEAGCKLDTVGFTSFDLKGLDGGPTRFVTAYLDGKVEAFASAVGMNGTGWMDDFPTPAGVALQGLIDQTLHRYGLNEVLATLNMTYSRKAGLDQANSAWRLYMEDAVPTTINNPRVNPSYDPDAPGFVLLSSGDFSVDLFEGPLTVDDVYTSMPYANFFFEQKPLNGSVLAMVYEDLNRGGSSAAVPKWVPSETPSLLPPGQSYTLLYPDYGAGDVEDALCAATGKCDWGGKREAHWSEANQTHVLVSHFRQLRDGQ